MRMVGQSLAAVSRYVTTVRLAGSPKLIELSELLVYAIWTNVSQNCPFNFFIDEFQGVILLSIAIRKQMATLESGSEPSFHLFVLSYVQDQVCCIEHESIP